MPASGEVAAVAGVPAPVAGAPRPASALEPAVLRLCQHLAPGARPVAIPAAARAGASEADRFAEVARAADRAGGAVRFGWALYQWPGIVEAVFHAVVAEPGGELRDVCPFTPGLAETLFLPEARGSGAPGVAAE